MNRPEAMIQLRRHDCTTDGKNIWWADGWLTTLGDDGCFYERTGNSTYEKQTDPGAIAIRWEIINNQELYS